MRRPVEKGHRSVLTEPVAKQGPPRRPGGQQVPRHREVPGIEALGLAQVPQTADKPEGDRLDLWVTLVEAYEAKCHAIPPPDPIEAIKFRMEQLGLSKSDIAPYLGGRSRVSEVLNRKRSLSVNMMKRLHNELHIPADSLLGV